MINIPFLKKLTVFFWVVIFIPIAAGISLGGNIIVKPGKFDHFTVQLPEKARAGEGFAVKLQAYDVHDNLITDFGETGKDFKISVTGSASAQPSLLKASSFAGGASGFNVSDKKAETVTISIFEAGGTVAVLTKEVAITPNKLDHFFVQAPQSVTAGNNFDVKIIARDAFDNTITEGEVESKNIKISSSGSTSFRIINSVTALRNGEAIVTLMAERVGESSVDVLDASSGSKGMSMGIRVSPAVLSRFKVSAPKEAVAGEAFEVSIGTFDAYDNLVENYASYGGGVVIASTGQAKLNPSFISQSEFRNGQAIARLQYEKAEEISIIVTENNKNQQGKSTPVKINPASPDHFVVVTPDTAIAGQKFRIKVEAYDRFNNMVKNYNLVGNDVYLSSTGTGVLTPKTVLASEFVEGVAAVDAVYDKAESFTISASITGKREEKKAVKEHREEIKDAEEPVIVPEKPVTKPKPAEKPKTEKQKPEEKKEKHAVITKEEKPSPKKTEKAEKVFEIRKVSLIEAKNKAMLIINMKSAEGSLEYKSELETIGGKDLIRLSLKPAANRSKKSLWKFKSAFVGEIRIEDSKTEPGIVDITIETLSRQAKLDINKIKNSLVVSISNQ